MNTIEASKKNCIKYIENDRFLMCKWLSFFDVIDKTNKAVHRIGDGVDMFSDPSDPEQCIPPGSDHWWECAAEWLDTLDEFDKEDYEAMFERKNHE